MAIQGFRGESASMEDILTVEEKLCIITHGLPLFLLNEMRKMIWNNLQSLVRSTQPNA